MMKKIVHLIMTVVVLLAATQTVEARRKSRQDGSDYKVIGSIVGTNGEMIEFATVVLLDNEGNQVAGVVSLSEGKFELTAKKGDYTLLVNYLGYNDANVAIKLDSDKTLEPIKMEEGAVQVEEVVVKGRLITREADRFVMNIADSPMAAGRDTYDMLSMAPGVWAKDGDIKINGMGGTKIYINDRQVRMSGEELENYLKGIPAENIQKIEVIPISGADYDADNAGGIIKITIKKLRSQGVSGSAGYRQGLGTSKDVYSTSYSPWANINYNSGKLNIYGNGSYYKQSSILSLVERTKYTNESYIDSDGVLDHIYSGAGGMLGVIYDFDEKHSTGIEYNIWKNFPDENISNGNSTFNDLTHQTKNKSRYTKIDDGINHSVTLNYINKLDTLGSTLKIIGDFAQNISNGNNFNENEATIFDMNDNIFRGPTDSTYRDNSFSNYRIAALTANVEQKLSSVTTIKYGVKYSINDVYSNSKYEYLDDGSWAEAMLPQTTDYKEHIAAAYGIFSTKFDNGISISAGLRYEHTWLQSTEVNSNYGNLFPNANISIPLNPKQTVILIGSYARKTTRPNFWALNPSRVPLSEYAYVVGNPDLRPTITNDFSLTGVFLYKYTFTLMGQMKKNEISQLVSVDEHNPNILIYRTENLDKNWRFFASINAPITITDWWNLNLNVTAGHQTQIVNEGDTPENLWMFMGNGSTTFTLPKKFFIDANFWYMSDMKVGNLAIESMWNMGVSVKKRFWDDRFTASVGINNIFNTSNQIISSHGEGFEKVNNQRDHNLRNIRLSISYNFQAGKMFNKRSVEKGAKEDMDRMSGGGGGAK